MRSTSDNKVALDNDIDSVCSDDDTTASSGYQQDSVPPHGLMLLRCVESEFSSASDVNCGMRRGRREQESTSLNSEARVIQFVVDLESRIIEENTNKKKVLSLCRCCC